MRWIARGTYSSPTRWPSPFSVPADSECIRFFVPGAATAEFKLVVFVLLLPPLLFAAVVAVADDDDVYFAGSRLG